MLYWTQLNIFQFTVKEAVLGLILTFLFALVFGIGVALAIKLLTDVTVRYPKFISFFTNKIW